MDNTTICSNSSETATNSLIMLDNRISQWVRIIVVTMVSVFIIASNIINVLVLRKTQIPPNARMCLINLGIADLQVGVISCAPCIIAAVLGYWPFGEIWCQIAGFYHGVSVVVSIWSLAFVSLDRYVAMVKSLHYPRLVTKTRCRVALTCLWIVSMASFIVPNFLVPDFLYYKFNVVEGICGLYWEFPLFCLITSVFPISSGIVIMCTTCLILRHLKKADVNLKSSVGSFARIRGQGQGSRDTKAVKILSITTCLYFICWGPYVVSVTMTSLEPGIKAPPVVQFVFLWIANSNSFINVLVYSAIYKSFREEIKRLVIPKCCRKNNSVTKRQNIAVSYMISSEISPDVF